MNGLEEPVDVRHPILQQVADAHGLGAQKLRRILAQHVLAEHEHADVRKASFDRQRGFQSFSGVSRRHPHVDDRQGRLQLGDRPQKLPSVSDGRDDADPFVFEQTADAFTQQHRIIGENDAHLILRLYLCHGHL